MSILIRSKERGIVASLVYGIWFSAPGRLVFLCNGIPQQAKSLSVSDSVGVLSVANLDVLVEKWYPLLASKTHNTGKSPYWWHLMSERRSILSRCSGSVSLLPSTSSTTTTVCIQQCGMFRTGSR
jgi:hypothetical protein